MNRKIYGRSLGLLIMVLIAVALMAGPSFAMDVTLNLKAEVRPVTMPDGAVITMWGFFDTADIGTDWAPGPSPEGLFVGDTLTINLTNYLSEPVSIVIPGQAVTGAPVVVGGRVQSFTYETPAAGTETYIWSNLRAGTYIYQSGTHPAKQVPMGLYGALKVDFAAGPPKEAYDGKEYDNEVVLLYSEIDPMLHDPTPTVAQPLNYKPEYFLINGQPYKDGVTVPLSAGDINQTLLIRFLNAGLKTHVPTLLGAHMSVIAEDGNLYPYPKEQYSVLLAAGKTMDALWDPTAPGTYPVYDARHHLTTGGTPGGGMLVDLQVGTATGAPVAVDDNYSTNEEVSLEVTAPGVLQNDGTGLTAILVDGPYFGTLSLASEGSFTYDPDPDFNGEDLFTYKVNDGTLDSNNVATVTITVNALSDLPVAVDDTATTAQETAVTIDVLANDIDVDGDTLAVTNLASPTNGSVVLNPDNTVTYTPNTGYTGTDSFTYTANDGTSDSTSPATVTITVIAASPNIAPVAVDNAATTTKNTPVDINVVANDYDLDGTIDPSTVVIATPPTKGGTAVPNPDGTVTFTPRSGFRGTDVFYYNVKDNLGAASNDAKVTVNVVK